MEQKAIVKVSPGYFSLPFNLALDLQNISFDVHDYKKDVGATKLIFDGDKTQTLMARWRFPSLSLHGIQVATSLRIELLMNSCHVGKVVQKSSEVEPYEKNNHGTAYALGSWGLESLAARIV